MRITLSARFTLKDKPKTWRGLYSEMVSYGRDEYMSLGDMSCAILVRLFNWFGIFQSAAELYEARDKIVEFLQAVQFTEEAG